LPYLKLLSRVFDGTHVPLYGKGEHEICQLAEPRLKGVKPFDFGAYSSAVPIISDRGIWNLLGELLS
ncbi:MAG: hypothetical protein ACREQK_06600, partial [Candidatus Binatia bacterium]